MRCEIDSSPIQVITFYPTLYLDPHISPVVHSYVYMVFVFCSILGPKYSTDITSNETYFSDNPEVSILSIVKCLDESEK